MSGEDQEEGSSTKFSSSSNELDEETANETPSPPRPHDETISERVPSRRGDLATLRSYREHAKNVLTLTGPIILSEIFQNTMPLIDIGFVGNLPDKDDLAVAALAIAWFNLWNASIVGFSTAIDTFLAQAYGANELMGYKRWTGTGLVIVMMATCVMAGIVAACGPAMRLFGQDAAHAHRAGEFSYRLIPGLFPYYAFRVLVKYLQAQDIVIPAVWIGFMANGINILLSWALMYKLDMGLYGSPWATTITRFVELFMICGYMLWNRNSKQLKATWPTLHAREMWNRETLVPFFKLAFSGALSMSAEIWSYEIATILAGLLGTVELNAHTIALTLATFIFYSFPYANGIAASIRVGQWMGDANHRNAQRSSLVSFLLSLAVQCALVSIVFPCRHLIGELFTSDQEVADTVASLVPIMCVFMLGDSLQATVGGVMRGLGQQKVMLCLNVFAYWILALPIGSLLMFVADVGLHGMWWAFVLAVFSSGTVGLLTLKYGISWEKEGMKAAKRVTAITLTSTHTPSRNPPARMSTDDMDSIYFESSFSTGGDDDDDEESCAESVVIHA